MKFIVTSAALVTAAASLDAAQPLQGEAPHSIAQTADRLSPDRIEQLVAGPISVFRKSGLSEAQKDFDSLLAAAVEARGKDSVEEADLLTSFGVQLYVESFDTDEPDVAKASLEYLERAIPVYRSAFGPRHPEVATALNTYADAALQVNGDAARADAEAALSDAYSIRLTALGPDNSETKAAAEQLAALREGRFFSASQDAAQALASAMRAIEGSTQQGSEGSETLTVADLEDGGLWKPVTYFDPRIDQFLADAERLQTPGPVSPSAIAAKYEMSIAALDATLEFLRKMDAYDGRNNKGELSSAAVHLVEASNRAPIALMLAAGAIGWLQEGCSAADIALLMKGSRSPDRDLWAISAACPSSHVLATAIDKSPAVRPPLLYLAMNWTKGDPATALAATDMLLRPNFIVQVDAADRDKVEADIATFKLVKLLELGLLREALAFGDSLSPEIRTRALKPSHDEIIASIGGMQIKTSPVWSSPAVDYAAALALSGRTDEARSVLDVIAPASKRIQARACLDEKKEDCAVGDLILGRIPLGTLAVDQLLQHPDADPYVLLESETIGRSLSGGGVTEVLCRLLSQRDEQQECNVGRELVASERAPDINDTEGDQALWSAIGRAGGQPFESAKAEYEAALAALGPVKKVSRDWTRATVNPAPVPFREHPIPSKALAKLPLPSLDLEAFAPLPEGYYFVRAERAGNYVVVISVSQKFDPNGEVTAGGYWVHLSDDDGKTWESPLYTGLAEHFPYLVPASSRLPMISGDSIHLEVEESLIDTASITYPPIGTKIRKKRTGIYLDIPVAELRNDSNGDGITDIAAHHLLLDGEPRTGTPFIVGSDKNCSKAPDMETLARLEILKKLFQVEAQALIEPVGAKGLSIGAWRKTGATSKPSIFLEGNPADYRCVSLDRLMVVYGASDQDRLRKSSPDFQLIELPPIRWNRDHTRGFVNWSMGWAGGTYRLTRDGDSWKLDSLGEWVT